MSASKHQQALDQRRAALDLTDSLEDLIDSLYGTDYASKSGMYQGLLWSLVNEITAQFHFAGRTTQLDNEAIVTLLERKVARARQQLKDKASDSHE